MVHNLAPTPGGPTDEETKTYEVWAQHTSRSGMTNGD